MKVAKYITPLLLCCFLISNLAVSADRATERRVPKLIQQLGARGYQQRKFAEAELRELGHVAIDDLLEAQYNESPEISLAAQQLLSQLEIIWTRPDERPIISEIVSDFGFKPDDDKRSLTTWLSKLEDGNGFAALARIARYEQSDLIAKQAAIDLMKAMDVDSATQRAALANAAVSSLKGCDRNSAQWIRAWHALIETPEAKSLATLRELADHERTKVSETRTSGSLAGDLYQLVANRAIALDDQETFRAATATMVTLFAEDDYRLVTTANWLLDHERNDLFEELIWDRFEEARNRLPQLMYCAAESKLESDPKLAEELAQRAYDLEPTDANVAIADNSKRFFLRRSAAFGLEERGLTEWAVREYRRLIASEENWRTDYYRDQAVTVLAELLHDRGRHLEAADTIAAFIGEDKAVEDPFPQSRSTDASSKKSRMHYFRSVHFRKLGDREKQVEHLKKAVEADSTDADVLIAMHRLPRADADWKEQTNDHIQDAIGIFEARLRRQRRSGEIENRLDVAMNLNQIAWLVSNTGRVHNSDRLTKAVQQSRRSLELRPQSAGHLDTLGRAYFTTGDRDNAIKYQRRAAKLEPHTRQIRRQLEEFEGLREAE